MSAQPLLRCFQCEADYLGDYSEPTLCPDCAAVWKRALRFSKDPILCARYVASIRDPKWGPMHGSLVSRFSEDIMRFEWETCERAGWADRVKVLPPDVVFDLVCEWCRTGERGPATYREPTGVFGRTSGWVHCSAHGVLHCQAHDLRGKPERPHYDPPMPPLHLGLPGEEKP